MYYCKTGQDYAKFIINTSTHSKNDPSGLESECAHYDKTLPSTCCFHNGPLEETLTDCLLSQGEVLTVLTIILLSTGWAVSLGGIK